MNNYEYIPGDNDCIEMTSQNRKCHPGGEPMILMNETQARRLVERAARKEKPVQTQPVPAKEDIILQLIHAVIPIGIAGTWVLGAMEGLADPVFTGITVAACGLWSLCNWKWGKYNAEN